MFDQIAPFVSQLIVSGLDEPGKMLYNGTKEPAGTFSGSDKKEGNFNKWIPMKKKDGKITPNY